jgi:nitrogen fixation/metabolism regulation signal transduction histidine kinase
MTTSQAVAALVVALLAAGASVVWHQRFVARKLRAISSVLAAFREGDFSVRARIPGAGRLFQAVLRELNDLGGSLRSQRLDSVESWILLRRVLAELDVVVLAFDERARVRLSNDAAARALGESPEALLGQDAEALGLAELLAGTTPRVVHDCARLGDGPWDLRRSSFRLEGKPHVLVALTDLAGALRDREREAWKRLVAVLGHEINNSLTPIQSISENLVRLLAEQERREGWEDDVVRGLSVVHRRAAALGRFTASYAALSRLPRPTLRSLDVGGWVRHVAGIEQRMTIDVIGGPELSLVGDADQLEQLLINVLKNAVDAALERGGGVRVSWHVARRNVVITVEDDGPGLPRTENLFVPFFTTKPGGTGIGLALARQIAEAHGGKLGLSDRLDGTGARAELELPLRGRTASGARPETT